MKDVLTVDDYKDVGVEIVLEQAGKFYTLYVDPRIKITINISGKSKTIKVSKLPKLFQQGMRFENYNIVSATEPLISSFLFFYKKRTDYPIVNYDNFLTKYSTPTIFTKEEIQKIMEEYNFVAAYIKWDGLCLATKELGVDLFLPAFLIDVEGAGIINEKETFPLPTVRIQ